MGEQIKALIQDLIPEAGEKVTFCDLSGTVHAVPGVMAARRQFLMLKKLEDVGPTILRKLQALSASEMSLTTGLLVLGGAILDPVTKQAIEELFTLIHPKACERALANGTEPDIDPENPERVGPFELFSLEEMIRAITPFLILPLSALLRKLLLPLAAPESPLPH
jgi:hypothetical protein